LRSEKSGENAGSPKRHVQLVRLRREKRDEYLSLHAAVWPEVEARLRASGIRNYSIHLHGDLLIGYFEYIGDDYEADIASISADPATQRWWTYAGPCQEPLPEAAAGALWSEAAEIWHLP
jgi:L-rhamnose mutarotase